MVGATARPRGRPRKSQAVAPAATAPINSFARVSKQAIASTTTEKDVPSSTLRKKRKAAPSPEPEEVVSITDTTTITTTTTVVTSSSFTQSQNKKARLQPPESAPTTATLPILDEVPATPRSRRTQKRALSPSIEESPRTKEASNLFKRLRIGHSPTRRPSPLVAASIASSSTRTSTRTNTPSSRSLSPEHDTASNQAAESSNATTPEPAEEEEEEQVETTALPQELLDVISLYASLLKTLTLHYAHNGTNAPVDLRQVSQAISIAWGKRRISLADVRRCVGIMDTSASASPFYLVDYGNKKVCIELLENFQGKPLDEDHLVGVFERNLLKIWNGVSGNTAAQDLGALVLSLPKATVQSCDSVAKASPLLSRGQRAMAELKQGIAARKEEKEATKAATVSDSTSSNNNGATPSGLKPSLLERLRLKEAQLAQLAATGPTPAELERKAALQRADDVAAVISMLAKSVPAAGMGGRVSFTMAMLLRKLKDSLRLPISQEEGAACVRLLAADVAPEWLKIVKIGGKENVVITTGRALSSNVVNERVRMLCV